MKEFAAKKRLTRKGACNRKDNKSEMKVGVP